MVAEASPFSACKSGASSVTVTVVRAFAISRATFTETGGPNRTFTARLSCRKPSHVTVNVYFPGSRKKNLYTLDSGLHSRVYPYIHVKHSECPARNFPDRRTLKPHS